MTSQGTSSRRNMYFASVILLISIFHQLTATSSISPVDVNIANPFNGQGIDQPIRHPKKWRRNSSKPSSQEEYSKSETLPTRENSRPSSHSTKFVAECLMPTIFGKFKARSYVYSSSFQNLEPIVMICGDIQKDDVIVRVHDQCFTGEVFGSLRCDCRQQLHESLKLIRRDGGIVIYLQQEGRGIGISNKIAAYSLQDGGLDTVDANLHLGFRDEMREYLAVPDILKDLGIQSIKLVTNNPFKIEQLTNLGVHITNRIPLEIPSNKYNSGYLRSKRDRMNHFLAAGFPLAEDPSVHVDDVITEECVSESIFEVDSECVDDAVFAATGTFASTERPGTNVGYGGYTSQMDVLDKASSIASKAAQSEVTFTENKGYAFGKESVEAALEAIRRGQLIIVVDDANRENEGDLIMAAELATPETIGFMVRYSSGVLCVSLESDRLNELKLPPMVVNNEDPKQTAYTVSVDCKHNTTTGISAFDRATTFRALADPKSVPDDFQRPGHVFPLRYKPGGVLKRAGHTEASLDFARLAGLQPAGVLAEVVNDDGSLRQLEDLKVMAETHGLVLTSVQDLIAYRHEIEQTEQQK